ncbi:hypothetical protein ABC733_14860 [Mangrovibacter sp. SLW1]
MVAIWAHYLTGLHTVWLVKQWLDECTGIHGQAGFYTGAWLVYAAVYQKEIDYAMYERRCVFIRTFSSCWH